MSRTGKKKPRQRIRVVDPAAASAFAGLGTSTSEVRDHLRCEYLRAYNLLRGNSRLHATEYVLLPPRIQRALAEAWARTNTNPRVRRKESKSNA